VNDVRIVIKCLLIARCINSTRLVVCARIYRPTEIDICLF
jgi:hypothetical protein